MYGPVSDYSLSPVVSKLLPFRAPRRMKSLMERALGFDQLSHVYSSLEPKEDHRQIPEALLRHLEINVSVSNKDLDHIPRSGPVLLVLNHPFGILDGAILWTLVSRIRTDAKILANGILTAIPELRNLLIPVDPFEVREAVWTNQRGIRQSIEFLGAGGLLIVFPAGEVSHFRWRERAVADSSWHPAIARMLTIAARRTKDISVIPAYVKGSNSLLFQAAGLVHPRLRTILLGRELLNKRGARVDVRIGSAIAAEKLLTIRTDEERSDYLRWRTYLLAARNTYKPRIKRPFVKGGTRPGRMTPVPPPMDVDAMAKELEALPMESQLVASGELATYIARAQEIPTVLKEIGRLREITFRAASEGTGNDIDLDAFDPYYLHLFVWNRRKREIAGAYRLAGTDAVRGRFGSQGLYTASLFAYGDEFLDRMGPALELGRSFVRLEYQKGFAPLLLLWKGIGKYVAQNPRYKVLFGPVSISSQYQAISRRLMLSFLQHHEWLHDWAGSVSPRNPFRRYAAETHSNSALDLEDLSALVSDLDPSQPGVPVLLRQYLKLGGKLLGFNVDSQFANALDGLIVVDLTKTEPKLLERYLGKPEAAQFLSSQKGNHGSQ